MDAKLVLGLCWALLVVSPASNRSPEVGKIRVTFTPTVCQLRCARGGCESRCEEGNLTAVYSGGDSGASSTGFRAFLCLLRCQNGGVCIRRDKCRCPSGFTGKFCQIPRPTPVHQVLAGFPTRGPGTQRQQQKPGMQTVYSIPLSNPRLQHSEAGRWIPTVVNLRVRHPPEVSVKVHRVTQVEEEEEEEEGENGVGVQQTPTDHRGATGTGPRTASRSAFGYCFTEIVNGQCKSPLRGLRTADRCCRGNGIGWGVTDCTRCPTPRGDECPLGFTRGSDGQCQDTNECRMSGICQNGKCVNTRGGHTCICDPGFVSDTAKTQCISQQVVSLSRGPCYRSWRDAACSLPMVHNVTRQICCCSRVGRGWGAACLKCPPAASDGFKEICPAGAGYHYTRTGWRPGSWSTGAQVSQRLVQEPGRPRTTSTPQPGHPVGREEVTSKPRTTEPAVRRTSTPAPQPQLHVCQRDPGICGPGRCVHRQQSHSCVCETGFQLNPQRDRCVDADECRETPGLCPNGRCENLPGTFRCVCSQGFLGRSPGTDCTDVDECADGLTCPDSECVNTLGSYRCLPCPAGYRVRDRKCADVNECLNTTICGTTGLCNNTEGSYRCDCNRGYRLRADGRQCTDINECLEGDFCAPYGECLNSEGSYHCLCAEGFTTSGDLSTCLDVDECRGRAACQNGLCLNTVGTYECTCEAGFRANEERTTCTDVDECEEYRTACGSQRCENSPGSYRCIPDCGPGYRLSHAQRCVDVDECANATVCGSFAYCQNMAGSYRCHCDQGYRQVYDGAGCVDVDECELMEGVCGSAVCDNVPGSFFCLCRDDDQEYNPRTAECTQRHSPAQGRPPGGSPGQRKECYYDLNDVELCENVLAPNVTREECCCTVGKGWGTDCRIQQCPEAGSDGFQSLCPHGLGYISGPQTSFGRDYRDADECELFGFEVCKNGVCVNTSPGYACYCPTGYYFDTVRLECTDHDECEAPDTCFDGVCTNTIGSYFCSCHPPLILDITLGRCVANTSSLFGVHLAMCWQEVGQNLLCNRPFLGRQTTYTECCCQYGEAWGMDCALCPIRNTDDYNDLCNYLLPAVREDDGYPYGLEYESYGLPYAPDSGPSVDGPNYAERDLAPVQSEGVVGLLYPDRQPYRPRTPLSTHLAFSSYDPRSDRGLAPHQAGPDLAFRRRGSPPGPGYGARGRQAGRGFSLRSAPRPARPWVYSRPRQRPVLPAAHAPRQPLLLSSGEEHRNAFQRYEALQAEECGVLSGCENGRCVRVPEGYTCQCYDGFKLDMTKMACVDIDECDEVDDPLTLCRNAKCVNAQGSYRCICSRGYVLSRLPNYCIPAQPLV